MSTTATPAADLQQMLQTADVLPCWPMTAETAVEILRANEFDVDVPCVESWFRSGQLGDVKVRGRGFAVLPHHILLAAALANTTRRWIPGSARHVMHATAAELAEYQAGLAGETIFTDSAAVSVRDLLGVIQSTTDDHLRSVLCTALRTKLDALGAM